MVDEVAIMNVCECKVAPLSVIDCEWIGDALVCQQCGFVLWYRVPVVAGWRLKVADWIDWFRGWLVGAE